MVSQNVGSLNSIFALDGMSASSIPQRRVCRASTSRTFDITSGGSRSVGDVPDSRPLTIWPACGPWPRTRDAATYGASAMKVLKVPYTGADEARAMNSTASRGVNHRGSPLRRSPSEDQRIAVQLAQAIGQLIARTWARKSTSSSPGRRLAVSRNRPSHSRSREVSRSRRRCGCLGVPLDRLCDGSRDVVIDGTPITSAGSAPHGLGKEANTAACTMGTPGTAPVGGAG